MAAKAAVGKRSEEVAASAGISDGTLRGFAGYHMKRAFNVVQADLARTLEPFGLRMITFTALTLIVENPDLSQSQLAGALAVERSNLVTIVDELESRGWITRNPSPGDRRSHALRATPSGRLVQSEAVDAVTAHEEKLLAGLDASAIQALIAALRTIERGASA